MADSIQRGCFFSLFRNAPGTRYVIDLPNGKWNCSFRIRNIRVDVSVRIGIDWWTHLGGEHALVEALAALIRACVAPDAAAQPTPSFTITDLAEIVSLAALPQGYNVSLLQQSQLEWLFFLACHYCDSMTQ